MRPKKGYPNQLNTLGDRLKACRLDSGLAPKHLASRIGVTVATIRNWETNRTAVELRYYPRILQLLGDNALDEEATLGGGCRRERLRRGLSMKQLASLAGVDEATIRRLEADTPRMAQRTVAKVLKFLRLSGAVTPVRPFKEPSPR